MIFGEKLQTLRKERNLSREDIASKLNISRQAVAKWESEGIYPDLDNLIALCDLLGVTIDSMLRTSSECRKHQEIESNKHHSISEFLCRAKKKTYAGKGPVEPISSRPNSHDLVYQDGSLKYIDTYLGGEKFAGEEAVWVDDIPIWSMNYIGRVLEEEFNGDFLKEALLLISEDKPFRGPSVYSNGKYVYHSMVDGDFEWFLGREEIYYDKILVYECYFHGGIIK